MDASMDGGMEPSRLTPLGPRLGMRWGRTRNSDTPSPLLNVYASAEPRVQVRQGSHERASGWTDARTGGWKNGWMDGGVGKGANGQARRLTHERRNARMGGGVGGQTGKGREGQRQQGDETHFITLVLRRFHLLLLKHCHDIINLRRIYANVRNHSSDEDLRHPGAAARSRHANWHLRTSWRSRRGR